MADDVVFVRMPDGNLVPLPKKPSAEDARFLNDVTRGVGMEEVKEAGRVADKAFRGGIGTLGIIGDVLFGANKQAREKGVFVTPQGMIVPRPGGPEEGGPGFGAVYEGLTRAGGLLPPVSEPKTAVGKFLGNVGQSTVGAAAGGGLPNLLQRAALGAAGGVGGEVGGAVGGQYGDGGHALGAFLGSLLFGTSTGVYQARNPNAKEIVKTATQNMKDRDWSRGFKYGDVLDAMGVPKLWSQVMGPRSTMADYIEQASGNPEARGKLLTHMATSSDKARRFVEREIDTRLGPRILDRHETLDRVQEASKRKLIDLAKEGNKRFEAAMPPKDLTYSQGHVQALYDDLMNKALEKYGQTSSQGKGIMAFAEQLKNPNYKAELKGADPMAAREFIDNAHHINNLIKGDVMKAMKESTWKDLPDIDIKDSVKAYTKDFDAARKAKRDFMNQYANPTGKSLTGQIANQGGGPQINKITAAESQVKWVFERGDRSREITQLGKDIGGNHVGDLLAEHLTDKMKQAWAPMSNRQQAPAKFADLVYGQADQQANVKAALRSWLDHAGVPQQEQAQLIKSFRDVIKALDTFKDVKFASGLSPAQIGDDVSRSFPATAAAPSSSIRYHFRAQASDKTYKELARLVMSPKGLEEMRKIAKEPKPERIQAVAMSLLATALEQERATRPGGLSEYKPAGGQ